MSIEQYIDDTKYLQWEDGMYVKSCDLECDYELALVEDSLRGSACFKDFAYFDSMNGDECIGVYGIRTIIFSLGKETKLTRAQALYIATGETECTTS
jgi:hypothetical protein